MRLHAQRHEKAFGSGVDFLNGAVIEMVTMTVRNQHGADCRQFGHGGRVGHGKRLAREEWRGFRIMEMWGNQRFWTAPWEYAYGCSGLASGSGTRPERMKFLFGAQAHSPVAWPDPLAGGITPVAALSARPNSPPRSALPPVARLRCTRRCCLSYGRQTAGGSLRRSISP